MLRPLRFASFLSLFPLLLAACANGIVTTPLDDSGIPIGNDSGSGNDGSISGDGGGGGDGATKGFTVGGSVTGLTGTGLVLQDNATDDLPVSADGAFTFATGLADGASYAVTVKTQPTNQTCAVTNGSGKISGAKITNVAVACTAAASSVGGTVTGLPKGKTLVLQDNGADDLTLTDSGPFTFATKIASGKPYAVTVLPPQPSGVTCTVTNGAGTMGSTAITNVAVTCKGSVTFAYTGAAETFTVPGGVTQVTITAFGAQGKSNAQSVAGGLGGSATGTLTVTSGQVLNVYVGGGGGVGTTAGFNGGGAAAAHPCATAAGGGGGGASDVRTPGTALSDRVIVAAGGGGAAGNRMSGCGRGGGGAGGGGYYGGGGGAGWPDTGGAMPTGGTQVSGGSAGTSSYSSTNNGTVGSLGTGGNGGPEVSSSQAGSNPAAAGAAGGGATGSSGTYSGNYTGASGAGGSSYIGGVTGGTTTAGQRSGAGQVQISW